MRSDIDALQVCVFVLYLAHFGWLGLPVYCAAALVGVACGHYGRKTGSAFVRWKNKNRVLVEVARVAERDEPFTDDQIIAYAQSVRDGTDKAWLEALAKTKRPRHS